MPFVDPAFHRYSASVLGNIYVISYNIGPCNILQYWTALDCIIIQIQIQIQKRFIETHRHIQQRYIRSLYNSKHSLEIIPAGTHRDNNATITSKRRCDVVPKQNDAAVTPRVRRGWHVIYKDISNSTWKTCVSMRVIRSPEAYTALNYEVWSNPDSNVCRANVVPTSVQLTSLSEDRILYWLCDVALYVF